MREIGGISFDKNQKISGTFYIDGTSYELPVTIISGKNPGKTVLLTAGVHACEYVGIQSCMELERELWPEDIDGTLIICPLVNRSGFEHRLPTLVPEDGKNLNRVYPGKADGTESEKLAYFFSSKVYPEIDFYMDIHSGSMYEDLDRYVYFSGVSEDPEAVAFAQGAAKCCDVPFMVKSMGTTGAYNYAGVANIPAILLERGGNGHWTKEEVEADKKDIRNMLRYAGLLHGQVEETENTPFLLEHPLYVCVSHSGCWYTSLKAGDPVVRGQEMGYITDYRGNVLERVIAEHDGRILYLTTTLYANKETEVVCYAKLCGGAECNDEDHHHECHEDHHDDVCHKNHVHTAECRHSGQMSKEDVDLILKATLENGSHE